MVVPILTPTIFSNPQNRAYALGKVKSGGPNSPKFLIAVVVAAIILSILLILILRVY